MDEFLLERGEEALGDGVVVAVALGAHRAGDAGVAGGLAEGQRDVLRCPGRSGGSARAPGGGARRPSASASTTSSARMWSAIAQPTIRAAVGVLDGGQVEPALPGAQVGDVGDPEHVRRGRAENWRSTRSSATRTPGTRIVVRPRLRRTSPRDAGLRASAAPRACATTRTPCAEAQLGVDARRAVDAAVRRVDRADLLGQPRVGQRRGPTARGAPTRSSPSG